MENESLTSESLGQVHRATIKSSGESIVLKVQYPNLQKVISSDLITIKRLLRLFDLLPKEGKFDELFSEVKEMLIRELDYEKELNSLTAMKNLIGDDPRYILPTPYANFSTKKVLAMSYEPGLNVDSDEVKNWNQERRNRIAQSFLELYFRELFEFRFMQTDPHLGNYRLRINHSGCDSLILYDYGAMKKISEPFWTSYYKVIYGALQHQQNVLLEGAKELGLIKSTDSPELINEYIELCYLFTEPFTQLKGNYNWRESNLPRRVATAGKNMLLTFHFRTPPRDLIFLDRKMAGVYSFLATLSATINGRSIVEKWIK